MAKGSATQASRGHRTICLPVSEDAYTQAINDPTRFRQLLDESFRKMPELFPANFARGYLLKDDRMSVKQGLLIRRILLRDGTAYSVRPSFLMDYRYTTAKGWFSDQLLKHNHLYGYDPLQLYLDIYFPSVAQGMMRAMVGRRHPTRAVITAATTRTPFMTTNTDVGMAMPSASLAHACQPVESSSVAWSAHDTATTQSVHSFVLSRCIPRVMSS